MTIWELLVEDTEKAHQAALHKLGAYTRATLVDPVCRTHGLSYRAGNGEFMFKFYRVLDKKEEVFRRPEDAKEAGIDLDAVFKVLYVEVGYNNFLGYYVEDVDY